MTPPRNVWFCSLLLLSLSLSGCSTPPEEPESPPPNREESAPPPSTGSSDAAPLSEASELPPPPPAPPPPPVPPPLPAPAAPAEAPKKETDAEEAPAHPMLGKLVAVNLKEKFVVIHFPQSIPPLQTELTVFRDREAVGTVRITKPINPPNATADIVSGSLRRGDYVR